MLQNRIAYRGPGHLELGVWRFGFKIWGLVIRVKD